MTAEDLRCLHVLAEESKRWPAVERKAKPYGHLQSHLQSGGRALLLRRVA